MNYLVENQFLFILQEMGKSEKEISQRIKKRLLITMFMFLSISSILIFFQHWTVVATACVVAVIFYKSDFIRLKRAYNYFLFRRELEAAKFMQLLAPILFEDQGNAPLNAVLSRLLVRVNDSLQRSLFQFMNEISSNPNDITPFIEFAKRTSNSDMFLNFMIALFDYQNSTADVTVLKELSEMANETMLEKVEEVIEIKNNRVAGVFNAVAMGFAIYLLPCIIFLVIHKVQSSNIF